MKRKYRFMVPACGAVALAALFLPAASACGGSFDGPFSVQQLNANPASTLDGASAENILRDARAAALGRNASIVGKRLVKRSGRGIVWRA
jgi:hypothetical protein